MSNDKRIIVNADTYDQVKPILENNHLSVPKAIDLFLNNVIKTKQVDFPTVSETTDVLNSIIVDLLQLYQLTSDTNLIEHRQMLKIFKRTTFSQLDFTELDVKKSIFKDVFDDLTTQTDNFHISLSTTIYLLRQIQIKFEDKNFQRYRLRAMIACALDVFFLLDIYNSHQFTKNKLEIDPNVKDDFYRNVFERLAKKLDIVNHYDLNIVFPRLAKLNVEHINLEIINNVFQETFAVHDTYYHDELHRCIELLLDDELHCVNDTDLLLYLACDDSITMDSCYQALQKEQKKSLQCRARIAWDKLENNNVALLDEALLQLANDAFVHDYFFKLRLGKKTDFEAVKVLKDIVILFNATSSFDNPDWLQLQLELCLGNTNEDERKAGFIKIINELTSNDAPAILTKCKKYVIDELTEINSFTITMIVADLIHILDKFSMYIDPTKPWRNRMFFGSSFNHNKNIQNGGSNND